MSERTILEYGAPSRRVNQPTDLTKPRDDGSIELSELLRNSKLVRRVTERASRRVNAVGARILLISKDNALAATIANAISWNCRHRVEFLDPDYCRKHDLPTEGFDLLLIRCRTPVLSSIEICLRYRRRGGMAPILVLLDEASTNYRIDILDAGADDYLLLPLNMKELTARVETLLRRPPIIYQRSLAAGHVLLDTLTGTVTKKSEKVHLRPMEYNLLEFLMQHPNQVFSSLFLWQHVWRSTSRSYYDTVRTHIKTLRMKLDTEGQPSIISTVRAGGYRLEKHEDSRPLDFNFVN